MPLPDLRSTFNETITQSTDDSPNRTVPTANFTDSLYADEALARGPRSPIGSKLGVLGRDLASKFGNAFLFGTGAATGSGFVNSTLETIGVRTTEHKSMSMSESVTIPPAVVKGPEFESKAIAGAAQEVSGPTQSRQVPQQNAAREIQRKSGGREPDAHHRTPKSPEKNGRANHVSQPRATTLRSDRLGKAS